ncbi:hypothetical protein Tco_0487997 [Tanacetum coccineum]
MTYWFIFIRNVCASFGSSDHFPSSSHLIMGVIKLSPSSFTTAFISCLSVNGGSNTSTKIYLVRQLNATEASLLNTSAFWFEFHDSAHMVAASKVPMLKPGEYEIWRMRIEQYIQMIDYALWEVMENGATLPKTTTVEGVMTEMPIITAEEKA